MNGEAAEFVDEYFHVHERGTELGRGGQGVVFRTRDPDVAIKLALDGNGQPVDPRAYVEQLRRVRALPVPFGLQLSAPLAVLTGTAGYAMRLLRDMVPFSHFWPAPGLCGTDPGQMPSWLAALPSELALPLVAYRDTGGLHRRLVALYKCSTLLTRLHGAGLVYGDVSPSNAFISRDVASREVWLIDADNLRYETPGMGAGLYTPRFGAPELVQGTDGGRPRTDCYAFAVMAFWMLSLLHPFLGAYVEAGGDDDWARDDATALDAHERAYAGLVPWILDEEDDRNRKDNGLLAHVLTPELLRLFQATLGPGRTKPWMRPSTFSWPLALSRAGDEAITCPSCRMGYYFDFDDATQRCPFCAAGRPRTLAVRAYDWQNQPLALDAPAWRSAQVLRPGSPPATLPHRVLYPFSVSKGDRDILELTQDNDELRLRCCDGGHTHRLALACEQEADDTFAEFQEMAALPVGQAQRGFWLRVAGPHPRVLQCRLDGGER